jgi:hypothetical protein
MCGPVTFFILIWPCNDDASHKYCSVVHIVRLASRNCSKALFTANGARDGSLIRRPAVRLKQRGPACVLHTSGQGKSGLAGLTACLVEATVLNSCWLADLSVHPNYEYYDCSYTCTQSGNSRCEYAHHTQTCECCEDPPCWSECTVSPSLNCGSEGAWRLSARIDITARTTLLTSSNARRAKAETKHQCHHNGECYPPNSDEQQYLW